ncbi:Peroxisomal biogenesis factor 19 [Hypsizygus marmoreus]|uniref:Peroxisomal biogenesis factor 19 n=1 Tax=Hypsizygus marmoreus TaxID=39966 RepID=A0A369J5L6_HYPMA|nr:Peroxisomal biogenesis factor 19 [Hypsizygus marmoreus]
MASPSEKQKPTLSNLPDADEDLEDLDDVLSQFNPSSSANQPQSPGGLVSPPPPPPTATTITSFSRPRTNTRVDAPPMSVPGSGRAVALDSTDEADEDELSAEFSRELAKGMESLMREIGGGPLPGEAAGSGSDQLDDKEAQQAFKAAWEAMLVEGMDGMGSNDLAGLEEFLGQGAQDVKAKEGSAPSTSGVQGRVETNEFQNKIKQAMDKLRQSESNLKAESTPKPPGAPSSLAGATPESLDALLASLGDLGLGDGDGPENEEELAGLLENMMGQLMSREVLYEPLKELADSFPGYLANPPEPLIADDKERYESQLICVRKIITVFDNASYSDSDIATRKTISDLMTEMQTYGSPPSEIMGPLPPGMNLGPDGLPTGEGCVIA